MGDGVGAASALGGAIVAGLGLVAMVVLGEVAEDQLPSISGVSTLDAAPDSYD
ncbi:hypothetical protein ABZ714_19395 [Streptomyces sp. NPDC006798]|uniref:hypothetical protein n=1 Tax=Streptomyces sp. NPDC006798 TaxID=3155462 RepID=UPI0033D33DCB